MPLLADLEVGKMHHLVRVTVISQLNCIPQICDGMFDIDLFAETLIAPQLAHA